ncbi:TIGR04149 family rSAM-modified RiPP [Flavobacterium sp. P4023]|uniref:TIGR04149 family rSAM-modified RiPP n=1 Tax=Flavobacterium flabelliforme TaxID=2816119 RepID=A0ABS5CRX8_9FLAO|nr:TIGR04149 family rSAM-modified RiPP [Flavobacterium flabelliforme]MBP4141376.1 TIGR04149 family rSAM-modified RiPP [Flavobacterium flabelliforme]
MKVEKLSLKNFEKNEISNKKLLTIYGGDTTDPKPGTTTSNSGTGVL